VCVCVCVCVRERDRTDVSNSGLCNAKCRDGKNKELDRAENRIVIVYLGYKHLS
jgi:hypothetical protein